MQLQKIVTFSNKCFIAKTDILYKQIDIIKLLNTKYKLTYEYIQIIYIAFHFKLIINVHVKIYILRKIMTISILTIKIYFKKYIYRVGQKSRLPVKFE